ncbi:hypothetical protein C8R47DRAFT_1281807 [Mycena vitilis]|nr:hypothetical protein C8R47DRAFT_1281807 [Mycena vitilis]
MAISVLVFGATGTVGSACARQAHSLGATVTLAVRDTNKPIPGLSLEQEKAAGYKRAQADLTKPETITAAVAQSGAKHAFVYLVHSPATANRAALEALKAAGVEFVVFLSSVGVALFEPAIDRVPAKEFIPYAHAQVELALRDLFGANYAGVVKFPYPETKFDWMVPEDIGRTGGTILAGGPGSTGGKREVLLCGPQVTTQGDAAKIIGKVVGKEVTVETISEEEAVKGMSARMPEHVARYLVGMVAHGMEGTTLSLESLYASDQYTGAVKNVEKYAGKATTLVEWATENKEVFE